MNKVMILGRLTRENELNYLGQNQTPCVKNSVAVDRGKDKDGNNKGADFIPIVVFGRQAEMLERYSDKGLRVAIEGHIQTGSYTTKTNEKRYTTDVIVDRVQIIDWKENDSRSKNRGSRSENSENDIPEGFMAITDNDMPF